VSDDTALSKVQQALALGLASTGRPEDRPAPPATPEQDRSPQVTGASELLRWQGEQTVGRVPLRGFENLWNDLRRRHSTVPPIPRELAPRVVEAESSARAVWQVADADVLAAAGRTPAQEPAVVTIEPPAAVARGGSRAA